MKRGGYCRLEHVWYKCPPECEGCVFCDGGLSRCTVCNCAEGGLLTSCPGYRLHADTEDAIYHGNVIDFLFWRELRQRDPQYFRSLLQRQRRWTALPNSRPADT